MKLSLLILVQFLLLTSHAAIAQEPIRIAYLSNLADAQSRVRAEEVRIAIRSLWAASGRSGLDFSIDIFPFSLSTSQEATINNEAALSHLLATNPRLIYAPGAAAAKFAASRTSTIPIVIGCKCNPGPTSKTWKLINNLCAPEGNITGFTRYDLRVLNTGTASSSCQTTESAKSIKLDNLFPKRLEILREVTSPPAKRIGMLFGDDYDEEKWQYRSKARRLGITLVPLKSTVDSLAQLPQRVAQSRVKAVLVLADSFLDSNTSAMIRATSKLPIPVMFPWDEAEDGAWMHYGTKVDIPAEAARYIVAILQGTPIRELPVSFPQEYELVVNHRLAKSHDWTFPKKFLLLPQREALPSQ